MAIYGSSLRYSTSIAAIILLFMVHPGYSQTLQEDDWTLRDDNWQFFFEKEPDTGILVQLSVYSGRPNPQWWIVPSDPAYREIIDLIKTFKTEKKPLYDYSEWNRLGYATFLVTFKNVKEMPYAVHIYRDMAYLVMNKWGEDSYAVGATEIYDLLVSQAEERDQHIFFLNYHKSKEGPEVR